MLDRKTAPGHAEISSFNLPSPEIYELNNGTPLVMLRGVSQHVIKIELVFNAGKWFESKKGVSYFTTQMLEKGTPGKSSFEIADFLDQHGASVEVSPGLDFVSVSLFSLTKNISLVLPLFLELVSLSVFPEDELILQQEIYNQTVRINNEKTSYVASKVIRQHLFGNNHPYGMSIEENDVNQITRQDLDNFFHQHFSLAKAFVVGAIDEDLCNLLIRQLSVITDSISRQESPQFSVSQNDSSEYIEKVNSVQSSLRLGKRIISRTHQDYAALVLLNHIYGGYFGSRLMKNIREEKGLTYGIYSSINNLKHDAFFVIAADVNRINKDIAITEIKNELSLLLNNLISSQELQTAKNHLLGSLQLEIANPFSVIEKIKAIHLYELGEGYYNTLFLDILGLNEFTLQEVANKHLRDTIVEVAVG
jgi:predicted Zn-dependent peptidase